MTERIACPVHEHAQKNGDQPAVLTQDHILSYQQLDAAIGLAGGTLKRLGVKPRERVALISPNTVEYIIALFALWRRGAVACLVSTRLPQEGVRTCLQNISCVRTIAPAALCQHFIPGTRTAQKVRVPNGTDLIQNRTFLRIMPRRAKVAQFIKNLLKSVPFVRVPGNVGTGRDLSLQYSLDHAADIMFTSGSSGEPKAVVHSLGNHYYSARAANEHIPVAPGDRWLLSLPLYHVGGLGIIWRTFLAGGTVVVPKGLNAQADLADSLRQFNITHVSLVPTQLHRLLSSPRNIAVLQKMKAILIGGSSVPDVLIRKSIDAHLPVYVSYGLTEMASQVATSERLTKENPLPRGHILKYVEARVSEEHEILVRGKTLFQGYINTTATPGVTAVSPALDAQGWFYTGDLGCLNEDGTLTVLGRKDNMFISGGENIQPEEIERHLCRLEAIVQAVVIPVKDDEFGARPVAFVQIKEGARLSRTEILSSLRNDLPSFKLPDQIYAWPATAQTGIKPDRSHFLRLIQETSSLEAIF